MLSHTTYVRPETELSTKIIRMSGGLIALALLAVWLHHLIPHHRSQTAAAPALTTAAPVPTPSPFVETDWKNVRPRLSIKNDDLGTFNITLTGQDHTYTFSVPLKETKTLDFPAGTYHIHITNSDPEMSDWNGNAHFSTFKAYSVIFVMVGKPVHFGD